MRTYEQRHHYWARAFSSLLTLPSISLPPIVLQLTSTDSPTSTTLPKILQHLDAFHSLYPRSIAPRRLTLRVAQDDDFRSRVRSYIVDKLEKGIPSLFVDVKSLYKDQDKMRVVGEVVEGLIGDLEGEVSVRGDGESITSFIWACDTRRGCAE